MTNRSLTCVALFPVVLFSLFVVACGSLPKAATRQPGGSSVETSTGGGSTPAPSSSAPAPSPPGANDVPSFTLSFARDSAVTTRDLAVLQNVGVSATVFIRRNGGFSDAVTLTTPEAVGTTLSGSGDEKTLTFATTISSTPTTSARSIVIRATAGTITREITLAVTVQALPPGSPSVSNVSVTGRASRTRRQGAGDTTLNLTGTNLNAVTSVRLSAGGPPLACTVQSPTATTLSCQLSVPHGVIGSYDLYLNQGTAASFSSALSITAIYVDSQGSDGQEGDWQNPFETVGRALQAVGAGDIIELSTESFALAGAFAANPCDLAANIPENVSLRGNGATLEGNGLAGLTLANGASVSNLTLRDFDFAITAKPGAAIEVENSTLTNTAQGQSDTGVYACVGSNVTLVDVDIEAFIRGVRSESATFYHKGGNVQGNVTGVYTYNTPTTLIGLTFTNNGPMTNTASTPAAIVLFTNVNEITSLISDCTVSNSGPPSEAAVELWGNASLQVQGSTFRNAPVNGTGRAAFKLSSTSNLAFVNTESRIDTYNAPNSVMIYDLRDPGSPDLMLGELYYGAEGVIGFNPDNNIVGPLQEAGLWSIQNENTWRFTRFER